MKAISRSPSTLGRHDAPRRRHRVLRRPSAPDPDQGHQPRRRVRAAHALSSSTRTSRASSASSAPCWATPRSISPTSPWAAARRAGFHRAGRGGRSASSEKVLADIRKLPLVKPRQGACVLEKRAYLSGTSGWRGSTVAPDGPSMCCGRRGPFHGSSRPLGERHREAAGLLERNTLSRRAGRRRAPPVQPDTAAHAVRRATTGLSRWGSAWAMVGRGSGRLSVLLVGADSSRTVVVRHGDAQGRTIMSSTLGPTRLVRHPIYTGIIAAAFATVVARGTTLSLLGACCSSSRFWIKARLEERFLRDELGAAGVRRLCAEDGDAGPDLAQINREILDRVEELHVRDGQQARADLRAEVLK